MKIGVLFPQTEFGNDPIAIRDYVQTAEALGFDHILAADHVLGANPNREKKLQGPYTYKTPFHEPLLLLAFMSASARRISFAVDILILPQRQTVLVAKQVATLDHLCKGRFRLGVGVGWNEVEYQALNENFQQRGRRIEEQIEVLRLLWTQPLVDFHGKWHRIDSAGINPLPKQKPVPIWIGGHADPVLRRLAKIGDGWFPLHPSVKEAKHDLEKLSRYLTEANRTLNDIGIEARIWFRKDRDSWSNKIESWSEAGATYIHLDTRESGLETPQAHISAIESFAENIGLHSP